VSDININYVVIGLLLVPLRGLLIHSHIVSDDDDDIFGNRNGI